MRAAILNTIDRFKNIVISPDMDGFMSAKLLNIYNGSKVVGAYDKNILLLAKDVNPNECLFVDCDMNRPNYVSIGNHMRLLNDNMANESFNPNVHYKVNTYNQKFPYATAFLIAFATEVETTDIDKARMAYADSTYKNLINYSENMHNWSMRLMDNNIERILRPLPNDTHLRLWIEEQYPTQSFTSRRYGKERYISSLNESLIKENIPHLRLIDGKRYEKDTIGKTTMVRYMNDIISYAEIYTGEYSVTYDQEVEWK